MKLKITDAAGREVREISGHGARQHQQGRASSRRAGICACSRRPRRAGGGEAAEAADQRRRPARAGAGGAADASRPVRSAPAAAAAAVASAVRRRFGGGGSPGPVRAARHLHRLADRRRQDGRHASRCASTADPEVVLTEVERKRMYDMAMEMHELQRRGTDVMQRAGAAQPADAGGHRRRSTARSDIPADVKSAFEAFNKELRRR